MSGPIAILLVEDNADDVEILRRLLRRSGGEYEVDVAPSGREALERVAARRHDVALVDQHLPDVTGEQLLLQLQGAAPNLPIIVLTRQGGERLAVEVMKAGASDYLRKDDLEPAGLHRALRIAVERARLAAEVERANERLREWAIRDGLTGLFNHRHFQELLRTEFARAARYGQPLACLMLDLDHFKHINDTYGHPFGDEVLKQLAATLLAEARKVDVVARYGGEEFVVLLPNTDVVGARTVAQRICDRVAEMPMSDGVHTVAVTLSVGVATTQEAGAESESRLVKQADTALYRAKRGGRNRVCLAHEQRSGSLTEIVALGATSTAVRELDPDARRLCLGLLGGLLRQADQNDGFGEHAARVASLSARVGRAIGLDASEIDILRAGALLHDVGRLAETEPALLKAGPLTDEERSRLPRHCLQGAAVLQILPGFEREREIVRHHHEAWDGTGYPDALAGDRIPILARVVCACDAWDALTSPRPWRGPFSPEEAARLVVAERGRRFDPQVVDALLSVVRPTGA